MTTKLTKLSVNYRDAKPAAKRHCKNCSMFKNFTCTLVKGMIHPDDVCDRWHGKPT
jgi:hypothetical protein